MTDFIVPLLAVCTRREAVQVGLTRGHIIRPTFNDARIQSSARQHCSRTTREQRCNSSSAAHVLVLLPNFDLDFMRRERYLPLSVLGGRLTPIRVLPSL